MAIAETLSAALAALERRPEDEAAVALAERYAAAMDEAAELVAAAEGLAEELPAGDEHARKRLAALAAKVEARVVLADLGPKMLAVLAELGMTPRARAGGGGDRRDGAGRTRLDELRERRAARQRDPAPVDPSSS